jgi:hypothetical protein
MRVITRPATASARSALGTPEYMAKSPATKRIAEPKASCHIEPRGVCHGALLCKSASWLKAQSKQWGLEIMHGPCDIPAACAAT